MEEVQYHVLMFLGAAQIAALVALQLPSALGRRQTSIALLTS
jgi:hypothetical protein